MLPKWPGTCIRKVNWANVDGGSNEHMAVMNIWLERIILYLFLRWLSFSTSLRTVLHVSFEMFILFCIGRTVAYRGKRSSTLTFLCVVITEQTVRLLAGLYSLPPLSLILQAIFVGENIFISQLAFLLSALCFFLSIFEVCKSSRLFHCTCDFQQLKWVFQL